MARGQTLEQRSGWRFFPIWLMAALGLVIAVDSGFIYFAEKTFPGETGDNPYGLGNNYNQVIEDVARQSALGWKVSAHATDGIMIVTARAADGSVLPAQVAAVAVRPLGDEQRTALHFVQVSDGTFQAQENLAAGRWNVLLNLSVGSSEYRATEHVIVK